MPTKSMPWWVKGSPFLAVMWNKVYNLDQNVLCFWVGGTGTCKSGSSISESYAMDVDVKHRPRFEVEDHVFFGPQELMEISEENYPTGSCFVWDEIQLKHSSRDFYELKNKLANKVMSTFRYKNYVMHMTLPALFGVDRTARELAHLIVEMDGKNPENKENEAIGHLSWVRTNPKDIKGKIYFPHLRLLRKDMPPIIPDPLYFPRPPADIEAAYKEKKDVFLKSEYASYSKQLKFMKEKLAELDFRPKSIADILEKVEPASFIVEILAPGKFKVESGSLEQALKARSLQVSGPTLEKFRRYLDAELMRGNFADALKAFQPAAGLQGLPGLPGVPQTGDSAGPGSPAELGRLPSLASIAGGKRIHRPRKPGWRKPKAALARPAEQPAAVPAGE